ncbi:MAG: helix-turn-helix domain-containing protein [Bryobacterales bacterium]|nr:helix-turn-helix domain-containing protein [Bryobacterales bacterium]
MARPVEVLGILDEELAELERRVRASTTSRRARRRARIVLLSSQGLGQRQVAEQVGVSVASASR